jgi:hypothetical protein
MRARFADPGNLTPRVAKESDPRVGVNIVEVDGLHRYDLMVVCVLSRLHAIIVL